MKHSNHTKIFTTFDQHDCLVLNIISLTESQATLCDVALDDITVAVFARINICNY